jgi:oxygen-independent coproporphyrinogen-3 oxidase
MIITNTNYDVAVINYPLMDPRIKLDNHSSYMQLDYTSVDPWSVPVYIHIPFCSSICKFCVYNRQVPDSDKILDAYIEALKREVSLYAKTPYIQSLKIDSIFMGGGTPTTLSSIQLKEIISALKDYLPLKNPEITVECNISNADENKINSLYEAGVTRISTGVQTFSQKRRDVLELRYTADDIFKWIDMVRKYPFKDVSIDLMYGLPGQTLKEFENDLQTAVSLPVDHFSIYKLTVFAYVKLYKELENKTVPELPQEEQIFEMYLAADRILKENNYIVQSSQEYCRKDNKSRFWDQTYDGYGDNLSFGAFSFGYVNGISYQNLPNPKDYIAAAGEGKFPIKMVSRKITTEQLLERTMMLGFRRSFIEKSVFYEQYGKYMEDVYGDILKEFHDQGYICDNGSGYELTPLGRYYQGNVSAGFMRSTFDKVSSLKKKMAIGMHVVPDALNDMKGV